jgi:hypothetical protein
VQLAGWAREAALQRSLQFPSYRVAVIALIQIPANLGYFASETTSAT